MCGPRPLQLERLHYWQGQSLRSRDARAEIAASTAMRSWHTRALHQAFGVVAGLEVSLAKDTVTVQPGLAYDAFGREIILTSPASIARPPAEMLGDATLVIASGAALERGSRECAKEAVATPILQWRRAEEIETCSEVPLARWTGGRAPGVAAHRVHARPAARPRVAAGSTVAGGTIWTTWVAGDRLMGLQATIDTSAAGFTSVPCYFAAFDIVERRTQGAHGESRAAVGQDAAWPFLLSFTHVADASIGGFRVRTVLPQRLLRLVGSSAPLLAGMRQFVAVRWLAVEPVEARQDVRERGRHQR